LETESYLLDNRERKRKSWEALYMIPAAMSPQLQIISWELAKGKNIKSTEYWFWIFEKSRRKQP
jgi:hypothetical protein